MAARPFGGRDDAQPGPAGPGGRAPDGNIITEAVELRPLAQRWPLLRLPVLRGVAALADSLAGAVSSLGRSAQLLNEEEIPSWQLAAAVAFALVLVIGLFFCCRRRWSTCCEAQRTLLRCC